MPLAWPYLRKNTVFAKWFNSNNSMILDAEDLWM
jgi:hypothetical protein